MLSATAVLSELGKPSNFEWMPSVHYDARFYAHSLESKTFGRVIDLFAIKDEICRLESLLTEAENSFGYFWRTALYLQEMMLTAQKGMKWLKRQETEQQMLRLKRACGPVALDITDRILSLVPTWNTLTWNGQQMVHVDGLLPHAIYNPSLLLPYYQRSFNSEWTLGKIAKQEMKWTLLEETTLENQIKLSIRGTIPFPDTIKSLMKYPHRWKCLDILFEKADTVIDMFGFCLNRVEELYVFSMSGRGLDPSGVIPPSEGTQLKSARLQFDDFSGFFNSGFLYSITSLRLDRVNVDRFRDHGTYEKTLDNLPHMLSQLPHLYELIMRMADDATCNLTRLPKVNSSSLRSLNIDGYDTDNTIAFHRLFSSPGCSIQCVTVKQCLLPDIEELFDDIQHVIIKVSPEFVKWPCNK